MHQLRVSEASNHILNMGDYYLTIKGFFFCSQWTCLINSSSNFYSKLVEEKLSMRRHCPFRICCILSFKLKKLSEVITSSQQRTCYVLSLLAFPTLHNRRKDNPNQWTTVSWFHILIFKKEREKEIILDIITPVAKCRRRSSTLLLFNLYQKQHKLCKRYFFPVKYLNVVLCLDNL